MTNRKMQERIEAPDRRPTEREMQRRVDNAMKVTHEEATNHALEIAENNPRAFASAILGDQKPFRRAMGQKRRNMLGN